MPRASRRGASAPESTSVESACRKDGHGTHQISGPRRTAAFSRGGRSDQNFSISLSRCASVDQIVASEERCCDECGPEYPPDATSTSARRLKAGRTAAAFSTPEENSAPRNSKIKLSESRRR